MEQETLKMIYSKVCTVIDCPNRDMLLEGILSATSFFGLKLDGRD